MQSLNKRVQTKISEVEEELTAAPVRCSMNRSNPFIKYSTILSILVTDGPEDDLLLLQLLSADKLTPRNAATSFLRTYRCSPFA